MLTIIKYMGCTKFVNFKFKNELVVKNLSPY